MAGGGTHISRDQKIRETLGVRGRRFVKGTIKLEHLREKWVYDLKGTLELVLNIRIQPEVHRMWN